MIIKRKEKSEVTIENLLLIPKNIDISFFIVNFENNLDEYLKYIKTRFTNNL